MMRRRGVGVIGTVAVAGAAAHHGAKKANQQAAASEQAQQAAYDHGAAAAQQAAAAAPAQDDPMAEVEKLAQMHAAGILTDEEFAAAKAKALGI